MVWVKINKIENSKYNQSLLVFFNFFGKEKFAIISDNVRKFLKHTDFKIGDEIFVLKSFSNDKEIYFIKNVRQN